jgi:hypothetical protein
MKDLGVESVAEVAAARVRRTLWTSQDVADFLQVSLRWVEKQRAAGVLPCVPLPGGRLVRYDPDTIRAWARGHATAGTG